MSNEEMYVTKRDGVVEIVSFDKILKRIKRIGQEANVKINYTTLTMKIIDQLYNKISTTKIDELTAEQCAAMSSTHPDYGTLASHITISNHHKNTIPFFSEAMTTLYSYIDKHGTNSPLISQELYDIMKEHADEIESHIDYRRDYLIDYFGFKTLERSYLMQVNKRVIERPQHMWMRVSLGIHGRDLNAAFETYDLM
jgi:transcriptional regulator